MTTEQSLSHGQLLDDTPEGWRADRHQSFHEGGTIVVSAPGNILRHVAIRPGQQLNVVLDDDGNVTSYGVGPDETVDGRINEEPKEGQATPTSETPQPQASTTGRTPEPQSSTTEEDLRLQDQSNFDGSVKGEPDEAEVRPDDVELNLGAADEESEWPNPTGGGWYELSNGEKVQGYEAAVEEQDKLNEA